MAKETNELVQELVQLQKGKEGGARVKVRRTMFSVGGVEVTSWKFNEWDYAKESVHLPTLARGLFTVDHGGRFEIATRGYDKFFNVDEVKRTKWAWIEEHTQGPYEMTLKENGCIIFLSAMLDGTLLVCSKHSTGSLQDVGMSHANKGEEWVQAQLATLGKSSRELAAALHGLGVTAVAELCDDSFEEHVLKYPPDRAGLYLHGLNQNRPAFITSPQDVVREFAHKWGFRSIESFSRKTMEEVKMDLKLASETGTWKQREIEGFVIRCKVLADGQPEDFFFKYKFDEPYLMYRQWREATKAMIGGKEPVVKKHQQVTNEYLRWVRGKFSAQPELKVSYLQNHGIIALREEFLQVQGTSGMELSNVDETVDDGIEGTVDGSNPVGAEKAGPSNGKSTFKPSKIVIVPVATVGCGKTTLALALATLFHWGHVQNDNITGKGAARLFANAIVNEMQDLPVVIADRNNHLRVMRKALFTDIHDHFPKAKLVAIHYVHYRDTSPDLRYKIESVAETRVMARGDNHQSIQATTHGKQHVQKILRQFINSFQPVQEQNSPDDGFDHIIELNPTRPTRDNLAIVIEQLHEQYPHLIHTIPSNEEMDDAVNFALTYQPSSRKRHFTDRKKELERGERPRLVSKEEAIASLHAQKSAQETQTTSQSTRQKANGESTDVATKKKRPIGEKLMYYAIRMPKDILHILDTMFTWHSDFYALWNQWKDKNRIQESLHVTLIHRSQSKSHPQLWETYQNIASPLTTTVVLNTIVWNSRVLAIDVTIEGQGGIQCVSEIPHITIGTGAPSIKPFEANQMLREWKAKTSKEIRHIDVRDYGFVFEGIVAGIAQ